MILYIHICFFIIYIWFCVILQTYMQLCSMYILVAFLDLSTGVGNSLWLVSGSRCYPSASESGMRKKWVFLHLWGDDDDPLMIVWWFFSDDDGWWLMVKLESLYEKWAASEAGCLRIRNFTCATSDAMSGCSCILYTDFTAFQHQQDATALNKLITLYCQKNKSCNN